MDCKELRIGNWIEAGGADGDYKQEKCEGMMIAHFDNLKHEPKPIPLTEEWLLKFGFEYIKKKNQYYFNGLFFFKSLQETKGFCLNLPENRFFGVFEYVHQLQNLVFSLKNIELEIKQDGTV